MSFAQEKLIPYILKYRLTNMWWDSAQISVFESIFFSFITIFVLYLVGFGSIKLLTFFGKLSDPFSSLDFFQKITFRVFFGFVFVVIIIVFFSLFGLSFWMSTLIVISVVGVGLAIACMGFKRNNHKLPSFSFRSYSLLILILILLAAMISLSALFINGSYASTNDDGADHTLMTRIVLDNPNVLTTRSGQPFANFLIRYPLGTHILNAFLVTTLGVTIQKIVILFTAVFPALIALSFYSTVKSLSNSKVLSILSLIIAGFFTIGSFFSPISWGGLPLLLSFYLTVSAMGLIFLFSLKLKITWLNSFLVGLIFSVAFRTYPVALLMISLWFLLVLIFKLSSGFRVTNLSFSSIAIQRKNAIFFLAFLVPILLVLPYTYAILTNNFSSVQNSLINLVSSWSDTVKTSISFNWFIDIPSLWVFFSRFGEIIALASLSLILLIGLFIPKLSEKVRYFFPSRDFRISLLLVYVFMLSIMGYLSLTLFLPVDFMTAFFDPARVLQFVVVPGIILTSIIIFFGLSLVYIVFKRLFESKSKVRVDVPKLSKLNKSKILAIGLFLILISSTVVLLVPVLTEEQDVYNRAKASCFGYQTIEKDDAALMDWIHANIPSSASILVSSGDSGQYLAAVTQRHTISLNSRLTNYSDLVGLLSNNSSDLRAIPLLIEYNVSYVYIGSKSTGYYLQYLHYHSFNSTQFLSTPYFTLTKEVGNAWLFEFNSTEAIHVSTGIVDS